MLITKLQTIFKMFDIKETNPGIAIAELELKLKLLLEQQNIVDESNKLKEVAIKTREEMKAKIEADIKGKKKNK